MHTKSTAGYCASACDDGMGKGAAEESRAWQVPAWFICVPAHLLILRMVCGDALQGYFACSSLCSVFCLQAMLMLSCSGDNLPGWPCLWGKVHIRFHKDASQRRQQPTGPPACRLSSHSCRAHDKSSTPQFHVPGRFNVKLFWAVAFSAEILVWYTPLNLASLLCSGSCSPYLCTRRKINAQFEWSAPDLISPDWAWQTKPPLGNKGFRFTRQERPSEGLFHIELKRIESIRVLKTK